MYYSAAQKQLIVDISEDVVAEIAKSELVVFPQLSEEYFLNPQKTLQHKSERGTPIEFGGTELVVLLTPIILDITKDVIKDLLKDRVTKTGGSLIDKFLTFLKQIFRKSDPKIKPKVVIDSLTPEQIAQIRQQAFEKACALNLDVEKANLLADSLIGSLVSHSE